MKLNRSLFVAFGLLILASSLYRVWDGRPFGFIPQIAMAIFAGAVIRDRKWSFLLPLVSMFLSDVIYEVLYQNGLSSIPGFYKGQFTNYILFTSLTLFGFMIRTFKAGRILFASLAAPTAYFLVSNFAVWANGGGYQRATLLGAYVDGLPFYGYNVLSTIIFSALFFGSFYLYKRSSEAKAELSAGA